MKIENTIVNSLEKYTAQPYSCEAVLSPNGWEQARAGSTSGLRLSPEELTEFTPFVESFLRECKTQNELSKFARKYGKAIDPVTVEICCDLQKIACRIAITGYHVTFIPYRKEIE